MSGPYEGMCAWCDEIAPDVLLAAMQELVDQLTPDTYCVICDSDTGEGMSHEPWCALKRVVDLLEDV